MKYNDRSSYKKNVLVLCFCFISLLSACQKKQAEPSAQSNTDQSMQKQTGKKKTIREQMLHAIQQNEKQLQGDHCAIDTLEDANKKIITGDLNQDRKTDFIYDYSVVNNCDGQSLSHNLAIFLKTDQGYILDSIYDAGLNELNKFELKNINQHGTLNVVLDDEKTQMIYVNKSLKELVDPNKKIIIPLGQETSVQDSLVAKQIDQAMYVKDEVECGEFFTDLNEKSTTIDRYDLRIDNDRAVIMGVYGLTIQDQVKVLGKTITSDYTLAQVKQLFKSGYELSENQNNTDRIGAASSSAEKLKYDIMLSVRDKNLDNSYLLYFYKNKLIAAQYFIPC